MGYPCRPSSLQQVGALAAQAAFNLITNYEPNPARLVFQPRACPFGFAAWAFRVKTPARRTTILLEAGAERSRMRTVPIGTAHPGTFAASAIDHLP